MLDPSPPPHTIDWPRAGQRDPELRDNPASIDFVRLSYYPYNRFTAGRETVRRDDPRDRAGPRAIVLPSCF